MKTKRQITTPDDIQKHYNVTNVLGHYENLATECDCAYTSTHFLTFDDADSSILHTYYFIASTDNQTDCGYNYTGVPLICTFHIISFYEFYQKLLFGDGEMEKIVWNVTPYSMPSFPKIWFDVDENVDVSIEKWLPIFKKYCDAIVNRLNWYGKYENYLDEIAKHVDENVIAFDVWKIKEESDGGYCKNAHYYFGQK